MEHRSTLVQYNCGHSNGRATKALFDSFTQPIVIAVQEPGYNKHTKSTYCPKPYQLAYEATPDTRVCFMIKRDIGESQWKRRQYGPNVATLEITLRDLNIAIINVYSPRGRGPRIKEWNNVTKALSEAQGEILLLGDFNAHHQAWGGAGVACEQQADHLLCEMGRRDLTLLTPPGEPTWERGAEATTIDLTFASQVISNRVAHCGTERRWALTPDHIPIKISLIANAYNSQPPSRRFALQKLNADGLTRAITESNWPVSDSPLDRLQEVIATALPDHCPKARPSPRARPSWSPLAAELLAGARQARRRYTVRHHPEDRTQAKALSNSLKHEMRRNARASWRRLIGELTDNARQNCTEGLWKLSRWSRRVAGKPHEDPHLPALRRTEGETPTDNPQEKAQILAEKFFPAPPQVDISDIASEAQSRRPLQINQTVTQEEIQGILARIPNNKAPGPDGIPNEVLKTLGPVIDRDLAQAISKVFAEGSLPRSYRESTTVTIRKEGKKDYSLPSSYRPIALENTLAKIVEKALANRITDAAEEHGLLPWNQMGARRDRSTLSAIGLITTCVETAWAARPGSVVSMLSLDLAGAYDNVSHKRLLGILKKKGFPIWLLNMVTCFLQERRTRIAYAGYEGDWIETRAGIPQGSPLSPILFLFYISELLEGLQDPRAQTMGFGFVDDTNLLTWSASAEENCRRLTAAHEHCARWANRHGAKFAPDKYQLIHFTRQRRHAREDLANSVNIAGHQTRGQDSIKVLGVWLDPKLTWKEHIAQVTRKGISASTAVARLATSTWGPSARNSRLLYMATVRPVLLYGAQEWATRDACDNPVKARLIPLEKVQLANLRRIAGGYKRTPRIAIEREMHVPPIDLYVKEVANRNAERTKDHPVERRIRDVADAVWERMRGAGYAPRPGTSRERARAGVLPAKQRRQQLDQAWRQRWQARASQQRGSHLPTTWLTPWTQDCRKLYAGLSKAEATALFLMRTEVIGLNAWLASILVPGILALCPCGEAAQTVRHVLLHCQRHDRTQLLTRCGTQRLNDILARPASAAHAARWLIARGVLEQFRVVREIQEEDTELHRPFEDSEEWS